MRRNPADKGFTLIEVLVAVLILAIGLLGLARLQATSLRSNHSGYLRSQATLLAYDIADRMRANRNIAISTNTYLAAFGDGPENVTDCEDAAANCSPGEMAVFDVNQWKCMLGNWADNAFCAGTLAVSGVLPGGDGSVTRDANNVFTIRIRYNERQGSLNADTTTIEMRTQL